MVQYIATIKIYLFYYTSKCSEHSLDVLWGQQFPWHWQLDCQLSDSIANRNSNSDSPANQVVYTLLVANNNDSNNNDKYPKAMKTLPLANYTAELSEEDSKLPKQEFCLFSSVQPIFPNNPMNCQIKIGIINFNGR